MTLAFDRSQRTKDEFGRLHIAWTPISKAMICPYYGHEIPNCDALGLDRNRVYQLLRHPEELAKAAGTFNNNQVMSTHKGVDANNPQEQYVAGSLGTDGEFRPPYLGNSMVIYRAEDIAAIESGEKRQISAGYAYDPDMTPGTYLGLRYDGVMRNIRGNHVALVEAGRAGPDVLVTDSGETTMTPLASRKALLVKGALVSFLRPNLLPGTTLALDGALGGVNRLNWQTEKSKVLAAVLEFAGPRLAQDAKLDQVRADLQLALDKMDDEEDGEAKDDEISGTDTLDPDDKEEKEKAAKDKKARDAKAAKDAKAARDKKAKDVDPDDDDEDAAKDNKGMDKKAMDAAIQLATDGVIARMNGAIEAREIIRPIIGNLPAMGFDSAEMVYAKALELKGVSTKDVHPSAFKAMVKMLPTADTQRRQPIAMDAEPDKALFTRFPGLARIGQA